VGLWGGVSCLVGRLDMDVGCEVRFVRRRARAISA